MARENFNRVVTVSVDIQKDFCPGGSLAVADGDAVVDVFNSINGWTRQNNGLVALTRDWHPACTKHFSDNPDFMTTWPVHCVANTPGATFHDRLDIRPEDTIISKGTQVDENAYSGFEGSSHSGLTLNTLIRPRMYEKVAVVIGGLATDYCVKATALDACAFAEKVSQDHTRKLGVFVVEDAIRAVSSDNGLAAIVAMQQAGAEIVTSQQIVTNELIGLEAYNVGA